MYTPPTTTLYTTLYTPGYTRYSCYPDRLDCTSTLRRRVCGTEPWAQEGETPWVYPKRERTMRKSVSLPIPLCAELLLSSRWLMSDDRIAQGGIPCIALREASSAHSPLSFSRSSPPALLPLFSRSPPALFLPFSSLSPPLRLSSLSPPLLPLSASLPLLLFSSRVNTGGER